MNKGHDRQLTTKCYNPNLNRLFTGWDLVFTIPHEWHGSVFQIATCFTNRYVSLVVPQSTTAPNENILAIEKKDYNEFSYWDKEM